MQRGTYVGPEEKLCGETALIILVPGTKELKAQFDNCALPLSLTHSWPLFPPGALGC